MRSYDLEMLTYLKLADLSRRKRQTLGSDKLLVLAGVAACRAGCLNVAERCREIIVRHHPRHLLARFASFADALRAEDFAPLLKRLKKLCPFEQAEFLARQWNLTEESLADRSAAEFETAALAILADADWQDSLSM